MRETGTEANVDQSIIEGRERRGEKRGREREGRKEEKGKVIRMREEMGNYYLITTIINTQSSVVYM